MIGQHKAVTITVAQEGDKFFSVRVMYGATIYFDSTIVNNPILLEEAVIAATREAYRELVIDFDPLVQAAKKA